jgi:hypothetical protein
VPHTFIVFFVIMLPILGATGDPVKRGRRGWPGCSYRASS